ncbi:MIZ zinc finger protein [Gaeumannomyces tritici R3-111a-1]|uniref:MIZ zinc finger protein n=1 Tax=Gaeumannomyces tritici (strain R3-111a-1) TaxID=644352 RepID=J3NKC5_GAET3|nr:MIZ zinc finger protein [Gaeumannomyces tritici R3-111a-1]EJT81729.1 MIZ zinc finger protein [Gaeumannomyces tritici R3-111a-1]
MTSTGYAPARADIQALVTLVNSNALLNRQLASICQLNGLRASGVKADLQRRIVSLIQDSATDQLSFGQVRASIEQVRNNSQNGKSYSGNQLQHAASHAAPPQPSHQQQHPVHLNSSGSSASPRSSMPVYAQARGYPASTTPGASYTAVTQNDRSTLPMPQSINSLFSFKPSPFYEPISLLTDIKTCDPAIMTNRRTVTITIAAHELLRHLTDPSVKIMALCALGNTGVQEIAFPHQSELKVNGADVKANLRGLKNKPGSTRPVDITSLLRHKPSSYVNNIEFAYALTNKKFYLGIYACKSYSVDSLVGRLRTGKKISRQSVVNEITRKARDTEIVTTSQVMSMKCPLSCMRLQLPVRSEACKHIQCFDATSYLQLQEQGPQWLCPICNQSAPFERLAVDDYAKEILEQTAKSVEQVKIEPDGEWRLAGAEAEEIKDEEPENSFNLDDDEVVISDISYFGGRSTATPARSHQMPSTPNTNMGVSREGSSMPRSAQSAGTKRPAPDVIDLTGSDDDEPSAPPPKRQNTGANGYY